MRKMDKTHTEILRQLHIGGPTQDERGMRVLVHEGYARREPSEYVDQPGGWVYTITPKGIRYLESEVVA